jgi:hypothetical protein
MIKIKFLPVFGVMAFPAYLTEIAFVRVLFAMTVKTRRWGFRELFARFVARRAGYALMAALEMEIRIIVVEGRTIQYCDLCIPANMFGMT